MHCSHRKFDHSSLIFLQLQHSLPVKGLPPYLISITQSNLFCLDIKPTTVYLSSLVEPTIFAIETGAHHLAFTDAGKQGLDAPLLIHSLEVLLARAFLSAAGWGGDGTLEVWQAAGLSVWDYGHREAEDVGWVWWGGRLWPKGGWGTGGLHSTRGSQHLWLELQQLTHEAEVGRDDAAPLLDEFKGFFQTHTFFLH